jgi:hypothetical protein
VDGRERREAEAAADLLETRGVAMLSDEFVQVIEDLALPFGQWEHRHLVNVPTIRKRKAKVNRAIEV